MSILEFPGPRISPTGIGDGLGAVSPANDSPAEIIDFAIEAAEIGELTCMEVSPETVLKMALRDIEEFRKNGKPCKGLYISIIQEDEKSNVQNTVNYRARLDAKDEVAYRHLGLREAMERWRGE